jgi:hypothetical protein
MLVVEPPLLDGAPDEVAPDDAGAPDAGAGLTLVGAGGPLTRGD